MALRKGRLKRFIVIAIYICVIVALVLYIRPAYPPPRARSLFGQPPATTNSHKSPAKVSGATADDRWLCQASDARLADIQQRYELKKPFQYLRRAVHLTRSPDVHRESLTKLDQRLLQKDFQLIQLDSPAQNAVASSCAEPLEVQVSASRFPQEVDASELIFGVSTTFERFKSSGPILIQDWSFWLTDGSSRSNGGKLVLMLLKASSWQLRKARAQLHEAGIDADVYASNEKLPMGARNLALVPTMYTNSKAKTKKWFVLCDDDTFFPNMHALLAELAKHDASSPLYMGALSEDSLAVEKHGMQAFGGAGIFLSRPTAKTITDNFAECSSEKKMNEADGQGDRLLRQCIQDHSAVHLTAIHDLWQLDLFEDPSGFYEWGTRPLSLHHYRSWHHAKPSDLTALAYIGGEECTLQRFQTSDDFILSGYSIAQYPHGITFDTSQVEKTFRAENDQGWNLDHKMGPQRGTLSQTGKKIAWKMVESSFQEDGSLLQTYIRRANDTRWVDERGNSMSGYDGVVELVWMRG
ncbi:hypothetical protein E4U61_005161 [Claviceps capensis]|nr:hypothetical protein E4U61_005161 [Claviceps capensis]